MTKEGILYLVKKGRKDIFNNFAIAFGTIWLFIECSYSLSKFIKDYTESSNSYIFLAVIFSSFIYAIKKSFPKLEIEKKFRAQKTSICVKVGNLLLEKGNIVIGSSDYFDTAYDYKTNVSLMSQVIKNFFDSKGNVIDKLIKASLIHQKPIDTSLKKPIGKKEKYEIGTIAVVPDKDRKIFVLAISNLMFKDEKPFIESDPQKLLKALDSLWDKIKVEGRLSEISMPVLGTGLGRANLSNLMTLQMIINSFVIYAKTTTITKKLNIIVNEENYAPEDMVEIERFLNSIQI